MWDRVVPVVLLVAVVVGAGLFLYLGQNNPPKPSEFPAIDQLQVLGTIPESWSVTGLDGKEISAAKLRGKVLFINRWATWCPPCMEEMPSIQKLYDSLKDSDVAFLIVSNPKNNKEEDVRRMAASQGWSMPVYLATEGFPPVLKSEFIPATFIANRKGQVVYRIVDKKYWNT